MRRTAVESLGKIGDPATALAVIPLIDDPNPMVRNAAAKAVGRTGSGTIPEVVPHLIRALEDTEAEVRLAAAEALGELEPPLEFLGPLVSLLSSHRREVRRAASYALIPLDLSSRSEQLAGAMHDPDPDVRQAIVAVLGEADAKEAALRIREVALHDPQPAVRIEAIYRLRHLDDEETRPVLKRIAETDRAEEVRRWARSEKGSRHGID
ncbi:hypothetical protein W02_25500 [Nitrospira sp. KM1]|nr:hypothetical protein W02_25500 [Nitrospira sp. KM1]